MVQENGPRSRNITPSTPDGCTAHFQSPGATAKAPEYHLPDVTEAEAAVALAEEHVHAVKSVKDWGQELARAEDQLAECRARVRAIRRAHPTRDCRARQAGNKGD
jgi:hypothetical protein